MKRVRYVGLPSFLQMDPEKLKAAQAAGTLTEEQIWTYESQISGGMKPDGGYYPVMIARPNVTIRILGPAEGLSRLVQWGPAPHEFTQEIDDADWAAIQRLPEAKQFALAD